jgi:hypothetical protein
MGVVQDFDNKFNTPLLNSVKYTTETDDAHPITKLLQEYGQMWVDCLNANIDKKQLIQTGELKQSIKYDPRIARGKVFVLKLLIADYYKYVDEGRRPGKFPPIEPIRKWVREKNLGGLRAEVSLESLAYLVARKIAQKGTKATHFYSECITEESVNELRQKLAQQVKQDMINLWR